MSFNGVRICTRFSTPEVCVVRPSPLSLSFWLSLSLARARWRCTFERPFRAPSEIERYDRKVRDRD